MIIVIKAVSVAAAVAVAIDSHSVLSGSSKPVYSQIRWMDPYCQLQKDLHYQRQSRSAAKESPPPLLGYNYWPMPYSRRLPWSQLSLWLEQKYSEPLLHRRLLLLFQDTKVYGCFSLEEYFVSFFCRIWESGINNGTVDSIWQQSKRDCRPSLEFSSGILLKIPCSLVSVRLLVEVLFIMMIR